VQLILALLDVPVPPAKPDVQLDAEARAKALEILSRLIAQTIETPPQKGLTDE
jgi:hypothetical protein